MHAGSRAGRSFAEARRPECQCVRRRGEPHRRRVREKAPVLVAGWTEGSLDRLAQILAEHGSAIWSGRHACRRREAGRGRGGLGRAAAGIRLRDRRSRRRRRAGHSGRPPRRPRKKRKRAADFIAEAASLAAGDIVVHADHGIGRFVGLKTIEAAGAPHDCVEIHYAGDDQAVPAGREHRAAVALRLGRGRPSSTSSAAGPGRRARRGSRSACCDMAEQLIKIAPSARCAPAPVLDAARRRL
jgi:transcription-repair coupling factor (superfamily II helicase)